MIQVLKNESEFVYGYVCFERVDQNGVNNDFGDYIYASDLWLHPWHRNRHNILKLIGLCAQLDYCKGVRKVYEERMKNGKSIIKIYDADTLRRKAIYNVFQEAT